MSLGTSTDKRSFKSFMVPTCHKGFGTWGCEFLQLVIKLKGPSTQLVFKGLGFRVEGLIPDVE